MWTLEGRAKSVHNGELSTVVDTFCTVRSVNGPWKQCPQQVDVHIGGASTRRTSTGMLILLRHIRRRDIGPRSWTNRILPHNKSVQLKWFMAHIKMHKNFLQCDSKYTWKICHYKTLSIQEAFFFYIKKLSALPCIYNGIDHGSLIIVSVEVEFISGKVGVDNHSNAYTCLADGQCSHQVRNKREKDVPVLKTLVTNRSRAVDHKHYIRCSICTHWGTWNSSRSLLRVEPSFNIFHIFQCIPYLR